MAVLAFFTLKLHIFACVTFGLLIEASLPSAIFHSVSVSGVPTVSADK